MTLIKCRFIAFFLILALLPLVAVVFAELRLGIGTPYLTRDISATTRVHPLTGALSSLGVLLWWSSATLWLFSALCHYRLKNWQDFRFALAFGLFSAYLALDDLFQFHELLAQKYLGLSEGAVYKILITVTAILLIAFLKTLLHLDGFILLLALGFLGTSIVVDTVLEPWLERLGHWLLFLEDGLKWLGIYCWCCFSFVKNYDNLMALSLTLSVQKIPIELTHSNDREQNK